jgi:hypothetical protein
MALPEYRIGPKLLATLLYAGSSANKKLDKGFADFRLACHLVP